MECATPYLKYLFVWRRNGSYEYATLKKESGMGRKTGRKDVTTSEVFTKAVEREFVEVHNR